MSIATAWSSHLGHGSYASADVVRIASLRAYSAHPASLAQSPSPAAPYRHAARFHAVPSLRPVPRVDERGAIDAYPFAFHLGAASMLCPMSCEAGGDDVMR